MAVRHRSRTSPLLVVALTLFCIALVGFGAYLFLRGSGGPASISSEFQVDGLDPAAQTGVMPGAPRNEKSPGEGKFSYRINASPTFDSEGKGGDIWVQNPTFNKYLMVLEIATRDEKAAIYQSRYIAPNQYIKTIDLKKPLEKGQHEAIAYLNAVDPATLELVGTLECPITITVE